MTGTRFSSLGRGMYFIYSALFFLARQSSEVRRVRESEEMVNKNVTCFNVCSLLLSLDFDVVFYERLFLFGFYSARGVFYLFSCVVCL